MPLSARLRRVGAATAAAAGLVVLSAAPAGAHVTVSSPDAELGGFGKLVFRVPSESDTAHTTAVTVTLPADQPFGSVSTKALPGWDVETTTTKLDQPVELDGFTLTEAVTRITWTADDASALRPHEFTELELSVGPFPTVSNPMLFPTEQTYSDGEVVAWDEPPTEGDEPEHPAPVLDLGDHVGGHGVSDDAAEVSAEATDPSDPVARLLGGVGLAFGSAALVWAAASRRQRS